jgi:two-component system, NtrC family, sensor kinase
MNEPVDFEALAAQHQLEHVTRLATLGTLASGIAHELGTPLNVVLARAKMIARGEVDGDAVKDNARLIVEQAERMTRIISELLDFARDRRPRQAALDLSGAITQASVLLQPIAEDARVAIEHSVPPISIQGDAGQLQQALTNLMLNGIQAMPEGGTLQIAVEETSGEIRIHIADQGTGIPEEERERIFKAFYTTKEPGKGTGLGLAVSDRIVKDHGGRILVESEVGRGSRFTIVLPKR